MKSNGQSRAAARVRSGRDDAGKGLIEAAITFLAIAAIVIGILWFLVIPFVQSTFGGVQEDLKCRQNSASCSQQP